MERGTVVRRFLLEITRTPIGLVGTAITTATAILFFTLFGVESLGYRGGPYLGIITFLVLPGFFVLGLALIPLGIALERRRARRAAARGEAPEAFPVIDLNNDHTRRLALLFLALTVANVVILSLATYKGVEVMETVGFCGRTCHSVMDPEYTTYQKSPHSRVMCVSCHIGPGAGWFVKSKLSGSWQMVAVTLNLYPRPIPTPVESLRPARETCEQCHWPTKFVGDRLKVLTHYADDEKNTEKKTVLLVRVGGLQGRKSQGIHWHVDPTIRIRYLADKSRETISAVELRRADGTIDTFRTEGAGEAKPEGGARHEDPARGAGRVNPEGVGEWRTMDCVDCHNRPSHIYRMPEDEIDRSILAGRIDRSLPFIRREALKALKADYPSQDAARAGIVSSIQGFYRQNYAEIASSMAPVIQAAAADLTTIYCTNVFPSMNIKWGTYPNHIGHQHSAGCFRCHDDAHKTADGRTISQDCSTCHTPLAMDEENPEILKQLQP
jgi:hypothetical protein